MATNARRATLVRALEASITGDSSHVAELYVDDVKGWAPAMSVSNAAELAVNHRGPRRRLLRHRSRRLAARRLGGRRHRSGSSRSRTRDRFQIEDETTIDPTGLRVTLHGVTVAEFAGDKIASFRQYWDQVKLLEQLALLPGE